MTLSLFQNSIYQWCSFSAVNEEGETWWFILCVHLAGPQYPDTWSNMMFLDEINIYTGFGVKQIVPHHVGGPPQSTEDFNRTKDWHSLHKRILLEDSLQTWTATSTLPWVSSMTAHPPDIGFARLYNHRSQFLKNHSQFLSRSPLPPPACLRAYTHTHS